MMEKKILDSYVHMVSITYFFFVYTEITQFGGQPIQNCSNSGEILKKYKH